MMTQTRFSPEPVHAYQAAGMFKLLLEDEAAWNLAYLSWDFDNPELRPDPNFSVNVRRTLQFVLATGQIDLTESVSRLEKVHGLINGIPPQVARRLTELKRVTELPLFKAYGQSWLDMVLCRSRLYREPHDETFDFEIESVKDSMGLLGKLK